MEGYGIYEYPDGTKYKGNWMNGKRHGQGNKDQNKDGTIYEGEWKQDARNGKGVLIYKKGEKLEATWLNNKPLGDCIMRSPEGKIIRKIVYDNNGNRIEDELQS